MFSAIHLEYRQDVAYGLNLNIEDLFFLNALMKTKTQKRIGICKGFQYAFYLDNYQKPQELYKALRKDK